MTSLKECIDVVQANCDWANIANVHENAFTNDSAECWCQKGNDMTPDDTSEYLSCWFGESNDTMTDGMLYTEYIFVCVGVHDQHAVFSLLSVKLRKSRALVVSEFAFS